MLACQWGCGLEGSVPRHGLCQAGRGYGTATAACVCRNGNNLLQQAVAIFNAGKPNRGKCSSLSGTLATVAATATVISTVVSTVLATSLLVVTTTGIMTTTQVLTSTVSYACPTYCSSLVCQFVLNKPGQCLPRSQSQPQSQLMQQSCQSRLPH